jgi:NAD(P)H-dependent flavin oxidoreductase YrpB (nitropropane dioxygenase family)
LQNLPFGVDLALPQVGGSARKTNHDYTHGHLPELIDIIIKEKARVFVSAVGVPPGWAVEKLHEAGILCGNMVGAPHHAEKAVAAGMDFVIAQGGEGGGHTGEIGTMVSFSPVKSYFESFVCYLIEIELISAGYLLAISMLIICGMYSQKERCCF